MNNLEMSAKGSFSFRNDRVSQTKIDDNIFLRVERIGQAVARVYFVNDGNAEVEIPPGFRVIDHTNNVDLEAVHGRQEFFLGWTDNYSLLVNNGLVVKLINQRQWAIQGAADRAVNSIEIN